MRNSYSYSVIRVESDAIFISDDDYSGTRSVTNAAEQVVDDLYRIYGDRRFIYRDSEGQWDELDHEMGIFLGFKSYVD